MSQTKWTAKQDFPPVGGQYYRATITDAGLEVSARITSVNNLERLIQTLEACKALLAIDRTKEAVDAD